VLRSYRASVRTTSRGEERLGLAGRAGDQRLFDRLAGGLYEDLAAEVGME
jgi:hypothetical protein